MSKLYLSIFNYISWGLLLGFITGINIALVMNFSGQPMTDSIEVLQFIFNYVAKWTLIGIGLSLFLWAANITLLFFDVIYKTIKI